MAYSRATSFPERESVLPIPSDHWMPPYAKSELGHTNFEAVDLFGIKLTTKAGDTEYWCACTYGPKLHKVDGPPLSWSRVTGGQTAVVSYLPCPHYQKARHSHGQIALPPPTPPRVKTSTPSPRVVGHIKNAEEARTVLLLNGFGADEVAGCTDDEALFVANELNLTGA